MNKIYVIGIGFRPLDKRAKDFVLKSDVVLATSRLLEVFKSYDEYEEVKDKIKVFGNIYETIDYIYKNYKRQIVSLLASGDPMFFGIGRVLVERFGHNPVEIFPDLSSIQVAFSRIKETSNNAFLMSLHGGPDPEKRRKLEFEITDLPFILKKHEKIAILTDKVNSPEKIAGVLLNASPSVRNDNIKIYVCEKLGYADERIIEGTPEQISKLSFEHPNVVIIIKESNELSVTSNVSKEKTGHSSRVTYYDFKFGLKETEIEHSRSLITKDEVRAITIHSLRLPQKGVFWDIGAGSGSISIEAARLCPQLKVLAIEKNEEQIKILNKNKSKFKIKGIEIVKGEAPEVLADLPKPDRTFIGGSRERLTEIVDLTTSKMNFGIIVINATTIDTLNEAIQCLEKNNLKVNISEVSVSRSKKIGQKRHMSALNPIFIVIGEKF